MMIIAVQLPINYKFHKLIELNCMFFYFTVPFFLILDVFIFFFFLKKKFEPKTMRFPKKPNPLPITTPNIPATQNSLKSKPLTAPSH